MNTTSRNIQGNTASAALSQEVIGGFFAAVEGGIVTDVDEWLDAYPSLIDSRNPNTNATAIVIAAQNGNLDLVRFLHQSGADLNASDHGDQGALFYAALKGEVQVANYLIDNGVDPRTTNRSGMSALSAARGADFHVFAEMLEKRRDEYLERLATAEAEARAERARQMAENMRQIADDIRNGIPDDTDAPAKAVFRRKPPNI